MYKIIYDNEGHPACVQKLEGNIFIPFDERNRDFTEFLVWNAAQVLPLDYTSFSQSEISPKNIIYNVPIFATDFFVSTPPINPDPEKTLEEAVKEMEKGEGNPKSIALIALSLAKYLKSKQNKLK